MAIEWEYAAVARSYLKRPGYAPDAISACLRVTRVAPGMRVCDVGAGTGTLTRSLVVAGLDVVALEPSAPMRGIGRSRVAASAPVKWLAGCAESMPLASGTCDVVTFGSSFNVVDRPRALQESARVLRPEGWFVCLWNHRRLDDPLQARVEELIHRLVPGYEHGIRREEQESIIAASGAFGPALQITGDVVHRVATDDYLEAWQSHLTLRRQAGSDLPRVLAAVGGLLRDEGRAEIEVPYTTRAWLARRVGRR